MAVHTRNARSGGVTRDRIAMGIMLLAALGALYAMVTAVGVAMAAGPDTQQVEWWRVFGFLMFAGVFVLLAFRPRQYPGLWELVILDKAALTVTEILLIGQNAANAMNTAIADGILVILLVAAYLLSRGYASWRR